jgi:hypothetical protein
MKTFGGVEVQVSSDFMSVLPDLTLEAILSQKCHMNMGPIISCYGVTSV